MSIYFNNLKNQIVIYFWIQNNLQIFTISDIFDFKPIQKKLSLCIFIICVYVIVKVWNHTWKLFHWISIFFFLIYFALVDELYYNTIR
jgi:hypothetical protein